MVTLMHLSPSKINILMMIIKEGQVSIIRVMAKNTYSVIAKIWRFSRERGRFQICV